MLEITNKFVAYIRVYLCRVRSVTLPDEGAVVKLDTLNSGSKVQMIFDRNYFEILLYPPRAGYNSPSFYYLRATSWNLTVNLCTNTDIENVYYGSCRFYSDGEASQSIAIFRQYNESKSLCKTALYISLSITSRHIFDIEFSHFQEHLCHRVYQSIDVIDSGSISYFCVCFSNVSYYNASTDDPLTFAMSSGNIYFSHCAFLVPEEKGIVLTVESMDQVQFFDVVSVMEIKDTHNTPFAHVNVGGNITFMGTECEMMIPPQSIDIGQLFHFNNFNVDKFGVFLYPMFLTYLKPSQLGTIKIIEFQWHQQ